MQSLSYASRLYKFLHSRLSGHFGKLLAGYWILIFILTSIPSRSLPALGTSDKVKHFGAYLVLSALFYFYLHFNKKLASGGRQQIWLTIILTTMYSIFDELHQILIPGRYFDYFDLLANFLGIAIGIFLVKYIIIKGKETGKE